MKKNLKGFTLVELVITIAIVIILSVVSVPIYRNYTEKAKMTEAYALLGTILSAQKAYFSEYGHFLFREDAGGDSEGFTSYSPVLGIDARGNKYFTWFWIGGGDGTGRPSMVYYFNGAVHVPPELRPINNNKGANHIKK